MTRLGTLALFLLLGASAAVAEDGLVLVRDGKSDYVIAVPAKPTATEKTAATELRTYLEKVTGAKLEILPEDKVSAEQNQIVVGPCKRLTQLVPDVKLDTLGYDGNRRQDGRQESGAGRTGQAGNALRGLHVSGGTRSAVVGGRRPRVSFRRSRPWRSPSSTSSTRRRFASAKPIIATPARACLPRGASANGNAVSVPEEYGGHERFCMFVHTFYRLLPPTKYFEKHPEWYSEIDGKRTYNHNHSQLCLTNDEMRKELTRNALARLRKDPKAGVISISQNDWRGQCQCEKCRGDRGGGRRADGTGAAFRQRGGRGYRKGVSRRAGRDARLPIHAKRRRKKSSRVTTSSSGCARSSARSSSRSVPDRRT